MSRDVKFRAWDKKSKKMRVVYCIVYDTNSQFSKNPKINLVNMWGRVFPAYDDGECNTNILIQREPKYVEIMQYTGLKDKNGKCIYEGDILSNSFMDDHPNKKSVVVWDRLSWRLKVYSTTRPMADNCGWASMSCSHYGDIEVIGNIYENGDLLR